MTAHRILSAAFACCALLLGAGCGGRDGEAVLAEVDEPLYAQGVALKKQGRHAEALAAFLKVIDKRGAKTAPESHLEAGAIFLSHTKDPVYAAYHFRRYLELQPNSKQAEYARGMVKAAHREFARTLPGRPSEDQTVQIQVDEEVSKLRRENTELRAELATLRGGGGAPANRKPHMITVPDEVVARSVPPTDNEPEAAAPKAAPAVPARQTPAPVTPPPAAPKATAPAKPAPGGRTHVVAPKETLYGISVKYYGHGRQADAIYQANRDVMQHKTDLRPGMTLRIPPAAGATAPARR